ncbi:hypothetical protein D7V97_07430 [Corallococcus sp. CA053C]|uniref:hypothetical protein n=1 Tax=Corallococcus sp. CA053C TaxID=2316732 RepID=UPI000EA37340|nr:hypothetical protein [Corallococcus sp. CA053C]RKH12790.1 hypothetical protein D7V97_07430 [Corallococcus sp. CA053C]
MADAVQQLRAADVVMDAILKLTQADGFRVRANPERGPRRSAFVNRAGDALPDVDAPQVHYVDGVFSAYVRGGSKPVDPGIQWDDRSATWVGPLLATGQHRPAAAALVGAALAVTSEADWAVLDKLFQQ